MSHLGDGIYDRWNLGIFNNQVQQVNFIERLDVSAMTLVDISWSPSSTFSAYYRKTSQVERPKCIQDFIVEFMQVYSFYLLH